ncbi:MAG: hypothetical protein FMNOHCHN_01991 [Ignavibacteriaceae bacterium]|nr:hypothetical protein [Ignavibacteriaceae bacterium]
MGKTVEDRFDDQPHYLTREGKRVHSRQVSWLKIRLWGGLPGEKLISDLIARLTCFV